MRRRVIMGLVGAALVLAGCWGDQSWRQKLTVTVMTPHGEVSGSSVTEVSMHINTVFKDGARYQYKLSGEAAVVDLGDGKYLFALLGTPSNPDDIASLLLDLLQIATHTEERGWDDHYFEQVQQIATPTEVPRKLWPMIVTFGDINVPASVKEVTPENSSPILGSGYSIESVTVQSTNDSKTSGKIEALLPWINNIGLALVPSRKKYVKDFVSIEYLGPRHFIQPRRQ